MYQKGRANLGYRPVLGPRSLLELLAVNGDMKEGENVSDLRTPTLFAMD